MTIWQQYSNRNHTCCFQEVTKIVALCISKSSIIRILIGHTKPIANLFILLAIVRLLKVRHITHTFLYNIKYSFYFSSFRKSSLSTITVFQPSGSKKATILVLIPGTGPACRVIFPPSSWVTWLTTSPLL